MDQFHKEHRIHASADQNPETKYWIPRAVVSWDENGTHHVQPLDGPPDRFQTDVEATSFAAVLGTKWIDDGKPDLKRS